MEIRRGLRGTGVVVPSGTGGVFANTGGAPTGSSAVTSVPVMAFESAISNRHGGRYNNTEQVVNTSVDKMYYRQIINLYVTANTS
jgi:hypothetical protein